MISPSPVYRPDGRLLARSVRRAAAMLGVDESTVRRACEVRPGGYWLVRRIGHLPRARIVLPDGRMVVGWSEAERLAGVGAQALYERAIKDGGVWYVREVFR